MNKRRAMSLLLALALCLCLFPVSALAAEDDFYMNGSVLVKYRGSGGDVVIPDGVTDIEQDAFSGCTGLTSVTIPASVTTIGVSAFYGCTDLTSVNIPEGVTEIRTNTFYSCESLTNVVIPSSVTDIEYGAFRYCRSLTSVTIPEGVTSIGVDAFSECSSLTSVTIPSSVTRIEQDAFSNCSSLTSVTIPASVTSIGAFAFSNTPWQNNMGKFAVVNGILIKYQGSDSDVTIPAGVTAIGGSAFASCSRLTSVTIPTQVTEIGDYAFFACTGLTSVTIPSSVTSIGENAFRFCTGLTSVTLPYSVTSISREMFLGCTGLTKVTIPSSVTSIEQDAFYECTGLTSITIPDSVTEIGGDAFYECTRLANVYYGGSKAQWDTLNFQVIDYDKNTYRRLDITDNVAVHYNSPMPEQPTVPAIVSTGLNPETTGTAHANTQTVKVDGSEKEFQYYKLTDADGGETNYVKLRDLADILDGTAAQFNVTWSEEAGVGLQTKTAYLARNGSEGKTPYSGDQPYERGNETTAVNGEAVPLQCFTLIDGAYTYYKLRDLGQALDFNVGWDEARGVFIETDKPYDPGN